MIKFKLDQKYKLILLEKLLLLLLEIICQENKEILFNLKELDLIIIIIIEKLVILELVLNLIFLILLMMILEKLKLLVGMDKNIEDKKINKECKDLLLKKLQIKQKIILNQML